MYHRQDAEGAQQGAEGTRQGAEGARQGAAVSMSIKRDEGVTVWHVE